MPIEEIGRVCFIGAGTMGCFNSLLAALAGYDTVVYDVSAENLEQVTARQQEIAAFLVGSGNCPAEAVPDALQRVSLTSDLAAATRNADLVSESVFEQLELKRQIHQQLDELCPEHTILTTNTSALLVSDIEDAVRRGDRFAALHSHIGATLFDIVGGPRTSAETIDILKRYVLSVSCVPLVLKKENKGYVLNAMLGPVLTMAMILVIEGHASMEAVDRAWMQNRRAPMGPFGMMDLFGLNVINDSWQQAKDDAAAKSLQPRIVEFLAPYLAQDELGMKSGKGFYSYPDPAYGQPGFLDEQLNLAIPHQALTSALLQNAVLLAVNGIADPESIDRAWMVATTLDTGPFGILDEMGIDAFVESLPAQAGLLPAETLARVTAYLQAYVSREEYGRKSSKGFYSYPEPLYREPDFLHGSA